MKNLLQKTVLLTMIFGAVLTAQDKSAEKITGQIFFDYTNTLSKEAGKTNHEFEFTRIYFGYENAVSDEIKYYFLIDADRTDADNQRLEVFIKNAKIDWITKYGTIMIGMQGMNMFTLQEANWGYRFIEKSVMDVKGFSSSADIGIAYANKITKELDVKFMVTNGGGFKKAEADKYKKYSLNLGFGENKLASKEGYNIGTSVSVEPVKINDNLEYTTVYGVFGGFQFGGFRMGAEFDQKFSKTSANVSKTEMIISAYANYSIIENLDVFGRADIYDPNSKTYNDGENYFIGGFNYNASKGLSVAPNIRVKQSWNEGSDAQVDFKVNFLFKI
ncbi:MAG: hypothetical protein GXX85_10130 [Ignavibacteria bacterium]|mgnify:CR=1 FL=1|nr:hypothetical protein [Ignavibacteria bacterium]